MAIVTTKSEIAHAFNRCRYNKGDDFTRILFTKNKKIRVTVYYSGVNYFCVTQGQYKEHANNLYEVVLLIAPLLAIEK